MLGYIKCAPFEGIPQVLPWKAQTEPPVAETGLIWRGCHWLLQGKQKKLITCFCKVSKWLKLALDRFKHNYHTHNYPAHMRTSWRWIGRNKKVSQLGRNGFCCRLSRLWSINQLHVQRPPLPSNQLFKIPKLCKSNYYIWNFLQVTNSFKGVQPHLEVKVYNFLLFSTPISNHLTDNRVEIV